MRRLAPPDKHKQAASTIGIAMELLARPNKLHNLSAYDAAVALTGVDVTTWTDEDLAALATSAENRAWLAEFGLLDWFADWDFPHPDDREDDMAPIGTDRLFVLGQLRLDPEVGNYDVACLSTDTSNIVCLDRNRPQDSAFLNSSVRQLALCLLAYCLTANRGCAFGDTRGWPDAIFSYRYPKDFLTELESCIGAIDPAALQEGAIWSTCLAEMRRLQELDEHSLRGIDNFAPTNPDWAFRFLTDDAERADDNHSWPDACDAGGKHARSIESRLPRDLVPPTRAFAGLHDAVIAQADFDANRMLLSIRYNVMGRDDGIRYCTATVHYLGCDLGSDESGFISRLFNWPDRVCVLRDELDICANGMFIHRLRLVFSTQCSGTRRPEMAIVFRDASVDVVPCSGSKWSRLPRRQPVFVQHR